LSTILTVPILNELAPGGFRYGHAYLVEFEPHSLWYELSFSVAAAAIHQGIRTEYHTFMHPVSEVRDALTRLGVNVESSEKNGLLRIYDTFSKSLDLPDQLGPASVSEAHQSTSFSLPKWTEAMARDASEGVPDADKKWLHIDDNTSLFTQSNDEKEIVQAWRTRFLPWARVRELVLFMSAISGGASEAFYRQRESLYDGIFDFVGREEGGKLAHYVRVRTMHGVPLDTRSRLLKLDENGGVKLLSKTKKSEEIGIRGWLKGSRN
jgi:KaiC/GvpD/RAD55 family RecA-like ATPase